MIEGVKIDLSAAELRQHLNARAEFHKRKADWYADRVRDLGAELPPDPNVSNNPTHSLQRSAEDHKNRYVFFRLLADHVIEDTYRLSQGDLAALEFASRYF